MKAVVLLGCGGVAFFGVHRLADAPSATGGQATTLQKRCMLAFALGVLVLCIVGTLFVEVIPLRRVIQLQLFRSTRFLALFCVLYGAAYARGCFAGGLAERIAGAAAVALLLFFRYALSSVLPLLVLFVLPRAPRPHKPWLVAACLCVAVGLSAWLSRPVEGRAAVFVVAAYALFAACALLALLHLKGRLQSRRATQLAGLVALGMLLCLGAARLRLNHARWGRLTLDPLPSNSAWVEVQRWCKANTPKDALFLTPPYLDGFRCFSDRPTVAEFKDGGAHMFNVTTAVEWSARMPHMIGGMPTTDTQRAFQSLSIKELVYMARACRASYLVVEKGRELPLKRLWSNAEFAVYAAK